MSVDEIREAIADLSREERQDLIRSLVPKSVKLSPEEKGRIQAEADAVPNDQWIDWEDLKAEFKA